MNRNEAIELLYEHTKKEGLRKHALAVEAAMRAYAHKFGEDEEKWGSVGLLHDFDYEEHPTKEEHPIVGAKILEEKGYPEDVIYAIKTHADYLGLERKSLMDKTLYAVDELTGFIVAVALVRPQKLMGMKVSSVKKKLKSKSFASGVNRDDIEEGAKSLDISLDEHIEFVIKAMQSIADVLGLQGG